MTNCNSVSILICLKNGKFATFVFQSFQLKPPYFKSSESNVSENNHVLPENIVLMYSKIFLNSKFKFSRKCQNKSVCVKRFLRCRIRLPEDVQKQRVVNLYVKTCRSPPWLFLSNKPGWVKILDVIQEVHLSTTFASIISDSYSCCCCRTLFIIYAGVQHKVQVGICAQRVFKAICAYTESDVNVGPLPTHRAPFQDSDQTARMRRLIRVFDWRTCQLVHFA